VNGKKILVVGATGQLARPVAESLRRDNEVWCVARFRDPAARIELDRQGFRTFAWDVTSGEAPVGLPTDFTHVMHSAFYGRERVNPPAGMTLAPVDFELTVRANTNGVAAVMMHCRNAEAFLYVSSSAAYSFIARDHPHVESDPVGGWPLWGGDPSYGVAKTMAEGAVLGLAAALGLPSTIARMNVSHGPHGHGGRPVTLFRRMLAEEPIQIPRDDMDWLSPIHTDDNAWQVPLLWETASPDTTILNWGGDEAVSAEELVSYLSTISGVPAILEEADVSTCPRISDPAKRQALVGECRIDWRSGIARTIDHHFPGRVQAEFVRPP
jgi:nucleoside-diphosphate-sugar epimerase